MAACPKDKDLLDMATEELNQAVEEEKKLQGLLLKSLLPKDDADESCDQLSSKELLFSESCIWILIARPSLSELRQRYERYSQKKGWKFDVIDVTESDLRGYKEASAAISGAGVYGKLKFESGIHGVQVSALPFWLTMLCRYMSSLRNEDLRIDTYRSGDSGGQHANTTNSAVRITHIPTGMTVSIQDERSQHMDKAKALKLLCAKLYEMERLRIQMSRSKLRSEQIGSGDRSELIRTCNFPQGRVMDRCVSITHHAINDVMQGENIDIFIDALLLQQEMDAIASFSSSQ
ncbi:hypothetical protein Patl1_19381 [Pistacia atlantica]|uniref:Uncharacterized protein n=1 Tax=Pistacia atlantica TaxID=434234 RepID=A0ACC1C093_9ROSI|nr:hypothetical protein Patl1_19381 [Pistacia atlantica]